MKRFRAKELIVPFVVAGTVFLGIPLPAQAGRTVRCESQGKNRHYCRVGIHGRIHLGRQLSRAACIEGQTWGADGNGIWVSGGCRAEFWIDDIPNYNDSWMHNSGNGGWGSSGGGSTIRCESQGRNRHYCRAYTGNGVHLVRQLSRSDCIYQQTWGYDSGGIWVSDGCRAEFSTDSGGWGGGGSGGSYGGRTIRCESSGKNRNYCRANTRGGVSLVHQLSRAACIQGQTWGYDGGGIWVDDGCRGEFQLGYQGHDGRGHHKKHHNNTAAVAAGALILGALVAVAATSGSKKKEKAENGTAQAAQATPVPAQAGRTTAAASRADLACRAAVQQKILDHYGEEAVVRFAGPAMVTEGERQNRLDGKGSVEVRGHSWSLSYNCIVDASSGKVVETHISE